MKRREFLTTIERAGLGMAAGALMTAGAGQAQAGSAPGRPSGSTEKATTGHRFRRAMYIPELRLPFDEELAAAKEIGVDYVWFNRMLNETEIAQMSDAAADRMAQRVEKQGLEIFLLNAGNPFKHVHLTDLDLKTMADHQGFKKDFEHLVRSMQIASRIGVGAVGAFTFAWPGEYSSGKPTWPMRWLTRGGVIAEVDMEKLVKAFTLVAEEAERYQVDVALSMMPWNYTNTTGNFRSLVERVGSRRLTVMWGPADCWNCGEWDVATAGFSNIRPYLHGLHLKDLHVTDGRKLKFEYRPLGDGDVDYLTILRGMRDHGCDVFLSLATHFRPPSGSRVEAMKINYRNLNEMIRKVEAEV
ncbi:MAG: sugar phosphate isomerase/epimerase [Acidobacteriota bacterium]|nr:sugar phosphate isomerase/epimerase [Acidobacteriota bacterium]